MAADWIGITSTHIDSACHLGEVNHLLAEALDAEDYWYHTANETHWFIIDLGSTYTITKVRGRSIKEYDPIDVSIYVSDDKEAFGDAVATNITTWQDTIEWQEVATTEKNGRYVKVEILDTEDANRALTFGRAGGQGTNIFDVFGEVAAVAHTHSASDTLSLSDAVAYKQDHVQALADTLTMSDSVAYVLTVGAVPVVKKPRMPYGLKPARVPRIGRIGV